MPKPKNHRKLEATEAIKAADLTGSLLDFVARFNLKRRFGNLDCGP
jgi:hypothetical protein